MVSRISGKVCIVTLLLLISYFVPCCFSQNHYQSYQLYDSPDGSIRYRLNVVVSESLFEYYQQRPHTLSSSHDFTNFVTPYVLEPIAERLWEIYTDDEDFANGVLMIVHQIPYEETLPVKYPVETIVENKGDCDLFSYIAASIMKAGGLDVVLLYYESEAHMNVGVHLSHPPNDARGHPNYVTYKDIRYYVAECTGEDWTDGWRVGECPDSLSSASPTVVTLENIEEWAPGQVSASYDTLNPSAISFTISSTYIIEGGTTTLSGQLSPPLPQETVTIYIRVNNLPLTVLDTITTRSDGKFTYTWRPDIAGLHYVRASWSGNHDYFGADSPPHHIMIFPLFLVLLLIVTVVLLVVGTIIFLAAGKSGQKAQEPLPPAIPSYAI